MTDQITEFCFFCSCEYMYNLAIIIIIPLNFSFSTSTSSSLIIRATYVSVSNPLQLSFSKPSIGKSMNQLLFISLPPSLNSRVHQHFIQLCMIDRELVGTLILASLLCFLWPVYHRNTAITITTTMYILLPLLLHIYISHG